MLTLKQATCAVHEQEVRSEANPCVQAKADPLHLIKLILLSSYS
jgi:hypothetical protein